MTRNNKLIIVDDETEFADLIQEIASGIGFQAISVASGRAFCEAVKDFVPDVVILDMIMPDLDGIEILNLMKEQEIQANIILTSGYDPSYMQTAEIIGSSNGLKVSALMSKPVQVAEIEDLLRQAAA